MKTRLPTDDSVLDTSEKRRAAAERAIAIARTLKRPNYRGNASDILIAERRLEFWREELEFLTRPR